MEYLRGILIGGFPWIPLGNTMVTLLPIAQLASLVGVYGLSLFVALLNAGFAVGGDRDRAGRRTIAAATSIADRCRVGVGRASRLASNTLTQGDADQGRPDPGQHRADRQVESGARRHDPRPLPAAVAAGRRQGRAVPDLAGVVHAVLFRGRARQATSCARMVARAGHAAAARQRRDRAGESADRYYNSAFMLDPGGRDRGGLSEDAPRAVRRVRAVPAAAVLRRSAGRSGVGVLAGHARDHAAGRRAHGQHGDLLRGDVSRRCSAKRCARAASC